MEGHNRGNAAKTWQLDAGIGTTSQITTTKMMSLCVANGCVSIVIHDQNTNWQAVKLSVAEFLNIQLKAAIRFYQDHRVALFPRQEPIAAGKP